MKKNGHMGLSLVLFAPFLYFFKIKGFDVNTILIMGGFMITLSTFPDIDLKYKMFGIKHRGITHSLVFGIGIGILLGFMMEYFFESSTWLMGFFAGFGGIISHLLGDALTYGRFKPFFPFSNIEVAYGLFKASNIIMNNAIFIIGLIAFTVTFVL